MDRLRKMVSANSGVPKTLWQASALPALLCSIFVLVVNGVVFHEIIAVWKVRLGTRRGRDVASCKVFTKLDVTCRDERGKSDSSS